MKIKRFYLNYSQRLGFRRIIGIVELATTVICVRIVVPCPDPIKVGTNDRTKERKNIEIQGKFIARARKSLHCVFNPPGVSLPLQVTKFDIASSYEYQDTMLRNF